MQEGPGKSDRISLTPVLIYEFIFTPSPLSTSPPFKLLPLSCLPSILSSAIASNDPVSRLPTYTNSGKSYLLPSESVCPAPPPPSIHWLQIHDVQSLALTRITSVTPHLV